MDFTPAVVRPELIREQRVFPKTFRPGLPVEHVTRMLIVIDQPIDGQLIFDGVQALGKIASLHHGI